MTFHIYIYMWFTLMVYYTEVSLIIECMSYTERLLILILAYMRYAYIIVYAESLLQYL